MTKRILILVSLLLCGCHSGHLRCYSNGTVIYDGQVRNYSCVYGSCSFTDVATDTGQDTLASCIMVNP